MPRPPRARAPLTQLLTVVLAAWALGGASACSREPPRPEETKAPSSVATAAASASATATATASVPARGALTALLPGDEILDEAELSARRAASAAYEQEHAWRKAGSRCKPRCKGNELCQYAPAVGDRVGRCTPMCGPNGACPAGHRCDTCATASCPRCRDCIDLCRPIAASAKP